MGPCDKRDAVYDKSSSHQEQYEPSRNIEDISMPAGTPILWSSNEDTGI